MRPRDPFRGLRDSLDDSGGIYDICLYIGDPDFHCGQAGQLEVVQEVPNQVANA